MNRLYDSLKGCFRGIAFKNTFSTSYDSTVLVHIAMPVSDDTFELPSFAASSNRVSGLMRRGLVDTVVVNVGYKSLVSEYKTLDASLCTALTSGSSSDLVKLPFKRGEDSYYASGGMIFDHNFQPVLMLTWEVRREVLPDSTQSDNADSPSKFSFRGICPIVRVAPHVVTDKNDSVRRYIVNRIIPTALSLEFLCAFDLFSRKYWRDTFTPKVIIGDMSSFVRRPAIPSVNTANKDLIHSALDHFDDFIL